jgi:hypothetical protein
MRRFQLHATHRQTSLLLAATLAAAPGIAASAQAPAQAVAFVGATAIMDSALVLTQRIEHLDTLAKEPMVAELADGTLFVAGYGGPPVDSTNVSRVLPFWRCRLWRSADGGATWSRVDLGPGASKAAGTSDVDLAVAPDGTLYLVTMDFDHFAGAGRGIGIGASHDRGATWSWTVLSRHRFDDRPWVKVAPDGTAHVIWNDGSGVNHAVSRDRGVRWKMLPRVHDRGGSSHLAIGPAGELAVRVTPGSASGNRLDPDVDLVGVSTDGGMHWQKHAAPGRRDWPPSSDTTPAVPRWVEPLAWDGAGRLYSLWTDTSGVWLARSEDRGATWTTWRATESKQPCYYPYLIARGAGELAATWRCGRPNASTLHVALLHVGDGAAPPRVDEATPIPILGEPALGEYVAATFLPDGGLGVVTGRGVPPRLRAAGGTGGFIWWRFRPQ